MMLGEEERRQTETERIEGRGGREPSGGNVQRIQGSNERESERTMVAMMRQDERNGTVI